MSRVYGSQSGLERGFVACELGPSIYAVGIENVQEIVIPAKLSALPHAPHGVIGAIDHRGEIVPILDLGLRLGFGETTTPRRKWILARVAERLLGVVVGNVREVFRVRDSEIRPAPEVGDAPIRTCREVVSYGETMAFILDMESLAALSELQSSLRKLA